MHRPVGISRLQQPTMAQEWKMSVLALEVCGCGYQEGRTIISSDMEGSDVQALCCPSDPEGT